MFEFNIKIALMLVLCLKSLNLSAAEKYYWVSASQGRVSNIVDQFSPFQLQVGHNLSGNISFKSKQINLAIKSSSNDNTYPVNILFNPTTLCTINAVPVSSVKINIEVNGVKYSRNSNILIEDDQLRQYRIVLELLGVSSAKRGSVLCDIKNALVIVN